MIFNTRILFYLCCVSAVKNENFYLNSKTFTIHVHILIPLCSSVAYSCVQTANRIITINHHHHHHHCCIFPHAQYAYILHKTNRQKPTVILFKSNFNPTMERNSETTKELQRTNERRKPRYVLYNILISNQRTETFLCD